MCRRRPSRRSACGCFRTTRLRSKATSLLILVAMVGAVILARKEPQ
jgi:hypothetical protein